MNNFVAYVRVSTAKQGERGVSLQEQRDAIERYAVRFGLTIGQWFEERETAAKRGRPVFNQMLRLLGSQKAAGVIIHKIDRSARNLRDWADLGQLIDQGIAVHFANESLDLHSRGGRLSADIQAVVAADYIRNLREETRKGFYGRLKQGLYPLPAPIGYLDRGKGQAKTPDPASAPLVRKGFELYATGRYNLDSLLTELDRFGLRNHGGGKMTRNGLSVMLNNPFYIGVIRLRRTRESFAGIHQPLISKSLFDRVQAVLNGKTNTRTIRHDFLFRRCLRCKHCGLTLIGERQKGHAYYRCHTKGCLTRCVREEAIEEQVLETLRPLDLAANERAYLSERLNDLKADSLVNRDEEQKALALCLAQTQDRLGRLTDAYLDGTIEKELFEERKKALLMRRQELQEQRAALEAGGASMPDRLGEFLELAGSAWLRYQLGEPDEKRELLRIMTSNREVDGKKLIATLVPPFDEVQKRAQNTNGDPQRDIPRTLASLWHTLLNWFNQNTETLEGLDEQTRKAA